MEWRLKSEFPWLARELEIISSKLPFYLEFVRDFRQLRVKKPEPSNKKVHRKGPKVKSSKKSDTETTKKTKTTKKSKNSVKSLTRCLTNESCAQLSSSGDDFGIFCLDNLDYSKQRSSGKGRHYSWGDAPETEEQSDDSGSEVSWSNGPLGLTKALTDNEVTCNLSRLNYFTMERCLMGNDLEHANYLNDCVLRVFPDNLIGLWIQIELNIELSRSDGFMFDPMDLLEKMRQLLKDEREVLIAKAEVAFMYPKIDRSFAVLRKSIGMFEAVLQEWKHLPKTKSMFEDLAANWHQCMTSYFKQLKSKECQLQCLPEPRTETLNGPDNFTREMKSSTKSDDNDVRCYLDEHTGATQSARVSKNAKSRKRDKALKRNTSVDYSLMLSEARQVRKEAKNVEDLEHAIAKLKECLEGIKDQKYIVYHHLGLAYRSLWLLTCMTKTGIEEPFCYRVQSSRNVDVFIPGKRSRVMRPPSELLDPILIPEPYKNIPRKIWQQNSNPLSEVGSEEPYLLQARRYFVEAVALSEASGKSLMMVELARTYINTGEISVAHNLLNEAKGLADIKTDSVTLYEQLGILEESALNGDTKLDTSRKLELVKSIYREAIRSSHLSKRNTLIAFYRLLEILYYQTQTSSYDLVIQNEYFLIYMAIQRAEHPWEVLEAIAGSDETVALSWKLIEMFHERNQPYDSAAAFAYLSVLNASLKLDTKARSNTLSVRKKMRIVLDVAERAASETATMSTYLAQCYSMLCRINPCYEDGVDGIAVIGDIKNSSRLLAVSRLVRNQLRNPFICTSDINYTNIEKVISILQKCQCFIIVASEELKKSMRKKFQLFVENILEEKAHLKQRCFCQAVFVDTVDSRPIQGFPLWQFSVETTSPLEDEKEFTKQEIGNTIRLLRALFLQGN